MDDIYSIAYFNEVFAVLVNISTLDTVECRKGDINKYKLVKSTIDLYCRVEEDLVIANQNDVLIVWENEKLYVSPTRVRINYICRMNGGIRVGGTKLEDGGVITVELNGIHTSWREWYRGKCEKSGIWRRTLLCM